MRSKLIKNNFIKNSFSNQNIQEKLDFKNARTIKQCLRYGLMSLALQLTATHLMAQADGNAGISQATSLIKGYFSSGVTLMYAIGALVGLIGAIKVYNKWSAGDPDTTKVASSWFGACIFLVVVATVLKSFFSV